MIIPYGALPKWEKKLAGAVAAVLEATSVSSGLAVGNKESQKQYQLSR